MLLSTLNSFSCTKTPDDLQILEEKLKGFSKSIKNEACDRDAVGALFVEAINMLDMIKKIYATLNAKEKNTAALLKACEETKKLEKIILEIERHYKQCSNTRKSFSSVAEVTHYDQTGVKRISIEEPVLPRYNDPSQSTDSDENQMDSFKK
ncbi:MAG: hypothetical protein KBD31_01015 [Proteobacteria bacterium]|nr:hypothetical protein [Pseudomonadota bacterium]